MCFMALDIPKLHTKFEVAIFIPSRNLLESYAISTVYAEVSYFKFDTDSTDSLLASSTGNKCGRDSDMASPLDSSPVGRS